MFTDIEIYDWLENNEHSLEGDPYAGYEIRTAYTTYWGATFRELMKDVLEHSTLKSF